MIPKNIIIHHSLTKDSKTVSWNNIRDYHISLGWRTIGYHYGIELVNDNYEILVGRMMNEKGAHCIQQKMNSNSIGICCIGNFDDDLVPTRQWLLCLTLVRSLVDVLRMPVDQIYGHREFANYKSCPGKNWSMNKFRSEL
jgi:hypothetical protein